MDTKAMFKIGYGLYVLTAREDGKDNGCIVNTFQQVTDEPLRVSVCVNKANHTCGMIARTGVFNVSVIAESATFDLFKRFGFQSGATVDKFADFPCPRSPNGVLAVDRSVNAVVSGKVFQTVDLGTHLMFLADVTDAVVRSTEETATYAYYQRAIKPRPQPQVKRGWRCLICGYFYEGEDLPADFVCPLCKHPASDFERIGDPAGATTTKDCAEPDGRLRGRARGVDRDVQAHGREGPRGLPRLRPPAGLLPARAEQLLILRPVPMV